MSDPPSSTPRPTVLLVDDNKDLVANLAEVLDEAGYQVRSALSCDAAIAAAERGGFHVALVDLQLPDGEGTSLAPRLKDISPGGEIVLLTGFATVETAAAAVRAGACAYLLKPCATPELLLTVEQAMRQVRLHEEKRELARRAQETEKLAAVGTLTAGLSHEIRNPLNAAGLQLTVLERRVSKLPKEQQGPLLEPLLLVRDEIRRLDHILEDFLQFARPREFHPKPVELQPLLNRTLDLLGGDAERRKIRVERNFAPCPPVAGDDGRLRQVVMNLALNALDATPEGGWIRVSLLSRGQEVAVIFEDSGPGVPHELMSRLFEPFFTTKEQGSGLGLSIVHAIVTQHRGSVNVENNPPAGARFTIRLPIAPPRFHS